MPPLFPKLIIKSFNGKEFNIQLIHDDLLIIDKNNKFFLYKKCIYKNNNDIKEYFGTNAFLLMNEKSEIIFVTFNPQINNIDRLKILSKQKEISYTIVCLDISTNDIIQNILLTIGGDKIYSKNEIIRLIKNNETSIFSDIDIRSNELIMLALIQNIDFDLISFVDNSLLNDENFWLKAFSQIINNGTDINLQFFRYLPITINTEFIFKILIMNPRIYKYLDRELRFSKIFLLFAIKNKIIIDNYKYEFIVRFICNSTRSIKYEDDLECIERNIDDDIFVEYINCNTNTFRINERFSEYFVELNEIFLINSNIPISFNKIIKNFDRIVNDIILNKINQHDDLQDLILKHDELLLKYF